MNKEFIGLGLISSESAMHFSDGADEETEYDYDADGNLIEDKNKGIPVLRITF